MKLKDYIDAITIEEFQRGWIGQGYGYKKEIENWEETDPDEIVYIPESGYENRSESLIYNEIPDLYLIYTKNDFINLAGPDRAYELFCYCDWQTPEAAWEEIKDDSE